MPMLGFISDKKSCVTLFHFEKLFLGKPVISKKDNVLLQMRWSGRKAVFPVPCTGVMKH